MDAPGTAIADAPLTNPTRNVPAPLQTSRPFTRLSFSFILALDGYSRDCPLSRFLV